MAEKLLQRRKGAAFLQPSARERVAQLMCVESLHSGITPYALSETVGVQHRTDSSDSAAELLQNRGGQRNKSHALRLRVRDPDLVSVDVHLVLGAGLPSIGQDELSPAKARHREKATCKPVVSRDGAHLEELVTAEPIRQPLLNLGHEPPRKW